MAAASANSNHHLQRGCLVRWQPHGIYGVVEKVESRKLTVALDDGRTQIFSTEGGAIERVLFEPGSQVIAVTGGPVGVVLAAVDGQAEPTWQVAFPGRSTALPERSIRPAEIRDPLDRMRNGYIGKAHDFNLKSVAADLWTQHLHNELVSLAYARVDLKPHQVGVAHRVIANYPHRFLLCDEVGLGKTIEAAMIVKELKARKQANRVLILVPSGLQLQWQFELKTKFNETFAIYNRDTLAYLKNQGIEHPWAHHDLIIASHTWASWTAERRRQVESVDWDLIIVDEAHHAREQRNGRRVQRTKLYRLVRDLVARPEYSRRAALFLTATPMQLQHHELYSLVETLDPILFSSEKDFVEHIARLGGLSQLAERIRKRGVPGEAGEQVELAERVAHYLDLTIDQAGELVESSDGDSLARRLDDAHRLSEVLIRNRRAVVGGFLPRSAFRWPVVPTELEEQIYEALDAVLVEGYALAERTNSNAVGFLMTIFQKLAASSSRALSASLQRRLDKLMAGADGGREGSIADTEEALDSDATAVEATESLASGAGIDFSLMTDLLVLLSRVPIDSKAQTLLQRLKQLFADERDTKVLVFTQFRETQDMLTELLEGAGWGVHRFHGQLNPLDKDRASEAFRTGSGPQIMVSTEAGGEGRNFQFCHLLVNYDLPWNPMKVEQRIGRIDRIGQEHPVVVFNLFVEGTVEERVLDVLENRINLFKEAIGGLEPIIGEVESDIRKALKLSGEARDRRLAELAQETEAKVRKARRAERQMADWILDTKSFSAGIARLASGAAEQVTQVEYEKLLRSLLSSVNTYVEDPNDHGVYRIMFHAPFSIERPDLLEGRDKRRVCFDPRSNVDSESVEYMGFGHPIIDALTESRISDWVDGAAAVRHVEHFPESGWQFNWLVTIGSVRPKQFVHPTFVGDESGISRMLGRDLLDASRLFAREETDGTIDLAGLEGAHGVALVDVGAVVADMDAKAREEAAERAEEERARIEAVHDHRKQAAVDRLESVKATLRRLEASERSEDQAVVPLWRANVERTETELARIEQDRNEMLADLARRMRPSIEFELLNVARVLGSDPGHP